MLWKYRPEYSNRLFPSTLLNELSGFNGITLKGDKYEYYRATGTLVKNHSTAFRPA